MNGVKVMYFMVMLIKSFEIFSVVIIHLLVKKLKQKNLFKKKMKLFFYLEFYRNADQDRIFGFGGLDGRGRKKKDPPIIRDLLLSLEDCYHGAIKKIKISRRVKLKIYLFIRNIFLIFVFQGIK
jgi:hypothetical protein